MNFIRKIAEGKKDDWVHNQFTRYGRGTYEGKALVEIRRGKSSNTIKTGFEFAGELAYELAETIKGTTRVTGGIITIQKIAGEVPFEFAGEKQFAGVRTFLIDTDLSKEQIQDLFHKFDSALILLSFKTDKGEIKTKVKNAKSGKPGKEDSEPKADFCSFKTSEDRILKDFCFDIDQDFSRVFIKHTFEIEELEIPGEYKDDYKMARKAAIRKGKLIRELDIDGTKVTKEYSLVA